MIFPLGEIEEITLRRLVEELANVVNWFHLGLYLDVPHSELMKIRYDYPDVEQRKTQALSVWMKIKKGGTWLDIVKALIGIRMKTLAMDIATKYSEFMSLDADRLCMYSCIPCFRSPLIIS